MTFLSYAQNFEDVMLHRALRGVARGFYIDVGAQHPINDSVTQAFYERGWRGINIDPVPQWAELLHTQRPHDINLQLALGAEGGHKQMFALVDTGLSTDNEAFVQRHLDAGYQAESLEVDVSTLDEICDRHNVSTVHFLKIDVEGAEVDVIRGFSFDHVRPWIVLVEAIEPVTVSNSVGSVPSYQSWEPILLARGYEFVYDDGLNRFYLAHEKRELREHFVLPPNPLDGFMRYQEWIKHERIVQLDGELKKLFDARDLGASRVELQTLQEKWQIQQRAHQDLLHDSANRLQRISMLEQETAALQAVEALRRAEFDALVSDSANRLERIAVLEQENAAFQAVDTQRRIELQTLALDSANRLERVMVLEQQNAALLALEAQHEVHASKIAGHMERIVTLERENAVLMEVNAQRQAEFERLGNRQNVLQREYERAGSGQASHLQRVAELEHQLLAEQSRRQALDQEIESLHSRHVAQNELYRQLEANVQAILRSSSWRVTKPLRWLRRAVSANPTSVGARPSRVASSLGERNAASASRPVGRSTARRFLIAIARAGFRHPIIGRLAWSGIGLFPNIKSRLVLFINNNRQLVGAPAVSAGHAVIAQASLQMPVSRVQASAEVSAVHQRLSAAMVRTQTTANNESGIQTGKSV